MGKFRTPRRRITRQRSGFNVSGDKTGSTCKIELTTLIKPDNSLICVEATVAELDICPLFTRDLTVLGAGAYIRATGPCLCTMNMSWEYAGSLGHCSLSKDALEPGLWSKPGLLAEVPAETKYVKITSLKVELTMETTHPVSLFTVLLGSLQHDYLEGNDVYEAFHQKQSIYIPEILYLDPTAESASLTVTRGSTSSGGSPIVCKSCNRCSRFLPIDILNERNSLGYSNHCVSRAPCSHAAFSRYRIDGETPKAIEDYVEDGYVCSHYGHQLECKCCKKFFVNLPLNPLRNSTQHREDSLRRRALEVLVAELLGNDWVYHSHRVAKEAEFDVSIWEKFGKKCFKCDKPLPTPNDMDLDHTMPLAYLWPLDNSATCLCSTCNSSKSDKFPVDYYTSAELKDLSKVTGLELSELMARPINKDAVGRLTERIDWFFDTFLAGKDYQKVREGKRAADLIVNALHKVFHASGVKADLTNLYKQKTGTIPTTVFLDK